MQYRNKNTELPSMYVLFDICFFNKSVKHTFSIIANLLDQH